MVGPAMCSPAPLCPGTAAPLDRSLPSRAAAACGEGIKEGWREAGRRTRAYAIPGRFEESERRCDPASPTLLLPLVAANTGPGRLLLLLHGDGSAPCRPLGPEPAGQACGEFCRGRGSWGRSPRPSTALEMRVCSCGSQTRNPLPRIVSQVLGKGCKFRDRSQILSRQKTKEDAKRLAS
ncbi:uncharacterized protein LOC116993912 [Catharus ustulatus]|uniref:uncharacterized protein LOC116993912 n=1 Tax=Catharus ustulatus TaxID=91951 RepID=UPI00140C3418|nr:uncharacterized protein LOC116993912 [Catharus ustulatus]